MSSQTNSYWAGFNNCNATPVMNSVSSSVERYIWLTSSGCKYVQELKIDGGGHDWPGIWGNMTIDASKKIWNFVSQYDINGVIDCQTTSVNENDSFESLFSIFPNPFQNSLTVESQFNDVIDYESYSILGERLVTGQLPFGKTKLHLETLNPNVSFITIGDQVHKVVKTD